MRDAPPAAPALAYRWRFVPRPDPAPRREVELARLVALEASVRTAHALGIGFDLELAAPASGGIHLGATDPDGARWVERVLATAYEPGQWRSTALRPPSTADAPEGRRPRLPSEAPAPDPGAVARANVLALAALPAGISVRVAVVPSREVGSVGPPAVPERLADEPSGSRSGGRSPLAPADGRRHLAPGRPGGPMWRATVRLGLPTRATAETRSRALRAIGSAWASLDGTGLRFGPAQGRIFGPRPFLLSTPELLGIAPVVGTASDLTPGSAPVAASIPLGRGREGLVVALPIDRSQGRHLAVLGETGMGKSSLLVAVAARAHRLGGLIVLDPLGDTASDIRDELDVGPEGPVWISPVGPAPTINALAGIGPPSAVDPVRGERRLADLVHALRRVRAGRYSDSGFWGPRLEEMLTRALRAAASLPDGTLLDAHALLASSGLTRRPAPVEAQSPLRELADRIRERPEDADGARRLLHEIVRDASLSRLLCDRTPDLRPGAVVMSDRPVLISGAAGTVGESTARYLLSIYLALVWSELLGSSGGPKRFVLLDEAQWFAHESLGEMLRLARRRNVHTVLATQAVASLPDAVREAVWTNVADVVAFRGSPDEAREVARIAPGVPPERLLGLGRGEAVALIGKGSTIRWIRSARLPRRGKPDRPEPGPAPKGSAGPPRGTDPAPATGAAEPPEAELSADRPDDARAEAWIAARLAVSPTDRPYRLPLRELREQFPNDPDLVRRLGARFGRDGRLLRSDRGPDGAAWWLVPYVRTEGTEPAPRSVTSASRPPQPS